MEITLKDVLDFLVREGKNGILKIEETGEEDVTVRYDTIDEERIPVIESHTFKYSTIILVREDLTEKKKALQAQLDEIN